ncbi:MAG: M23 family metallopeptidase [Clostridia bacterium]|nr:M23 family metallopeptidase [Clostridia bacterium]
MYKKSFKEKTKTFFKQKGFYLVCCACLVAVGMAAWSATAPISTKDSDSSASLTSSESSETPSSSTVSVVSEVAPTAKPESNVPKTPHSTVQSATESAATAPAAKYFVMPVTGSILKDFNSEMLQYSETFRDMRIHRGVDIACEKGTSVFAAGDGTVTFTGFDSMLGNVVKIDHGNGVLAVYCGLNAKLSVKEGDTVTSKTQVGIVGDIPEESVEQTHFHFEMYKDGIAVSPLKLLGME